MDELDPVHDQSMGGFSRGSDVVNARREHAQAQQKLVVGFVRGASPFAGK